MTNQELVRGVLEREIGLGKKSFAIIPFGKMGRLIQKELRENYGITEVICIDNSGTEGTVKMEDVAWKNLDCDFLFCAKDIKAHSEIKKELLKYVAKSRIIDIFYEHSEQRLPNVKLDFLCTGFGKCGTTSLDAALQENEHIFLPQAKEIYYLFWRNRQENSAEKFEKFYPQDLCEGKIVGGIEPSYTKVAMDVKECFGENLKILFLVRNPIKATYSMYKMAMRTVWRERDLKFYERFKGVSPDIFDKWLEESEDEYKTFKYMDSIDEYLKYYPKEQIKVVLFEDLVKEPQRVMDEIQAFIGIEESLRKTYEGFPRRNEGSMVCKNYSCALVNNYISQMLSDVKGKPDETHEIAVLRADVEGALYSEYKEPMKPETEKWLREYFGDSIKRMEAFLGREIGW